MKNINELLDKYGFCKFGDEHLIEILESVAKEEGVDYELIEEMYMMNTEEGAMQGVFEGKKIAAVGAVGGAIAGAAAATVAGAALGVALPVGAAAILGGALAAVDLNVKWRALKVLFNSKERRCGAIKLGKGRTLCIAKLHVEELEKRLGMMKQALGGCKKKKDPQKCQKAVKAVMEKTSKKGQKYRDQVEKLEGNMKKKGKSKEQIAKSSKANKHFKLV